MARLFDDASSEYLAYAGAVVASMPMTFACWFYTDDNSIKYDLMSAWESGGRVYQMSADGAWGGVGAIIAQQWTTKGASAIVGWSANAWHHACAVLASTTSRSAYLDGGNKGTNVDNQANLPAIGTTSIGRNPNDGNYMSGRIAEAAIWSAALTDAEVAALAKGYSPLLIRPQSLVAYWPLIRDEDQDRVGGYDMTPVNTPTIASHPPVIYPAPPFLSFPVATVGGVDITVPVAALEITGYAPTVATPVNVTVPVGVIEITGYAPVVTTTAHVDIEIPVGALEITGYVPGVATTAHVDIEIPVGALEVTGYAPVVTTTAHVDIEIPVGALEIAGYAPTVTTTGNIDIEVPVGALEIEGFAPTVTTTAHIDIEVPVGVLEITGYIPTITTTGGVDITVPVASLVLTGYAPIVTTFAGTVELELWDRDASLHLNARTPELVIGVRTPELVLEDK